MLIIGHLLAACGPPPPPDAVEAAAVGHVLARGDELLSTLGGPGRVRDGAVFAIPAAALEAVWRAGPSGGAPFDPDALVEGYFSTSAGAIRDAGGAFARLEPEGAFTLDVAGGEHLVCFTRSPGDDIIVPDGCALEAMSDLPVQLRVWTGERFDVEQLSVD